MRSHSLCNCPLQTISMPITYSGRWRLFYIGIPLSVEKKTEHRSSCIGWFQRPAYFDCSRKAGAGFLLPQAGGEAFVTTFVVIASAQDKGRRKGYKTENSGICFQMTSSQSVADRSWGKRHSAVTFSSPLEITPLLPTADRWLIKPALKRPFLSQTMGAPVRKLWRYNKESVDAETGFAHFALNCVFCANKHCDGDDTAHLYSQSLSLISWR